MEEKTPIEAVKEFSKKCMWWKCEKRMDKNTKISIVVAVLVVVAALGWYCKGVFIAATVNGHPIMRWEVVKEAEKQVGRSILDTLIAKRMISDAATENGITVGNEEIGGALAKIEESVKSQGGTLEEALAKQGVTLEQLKADLKEQEVLKKLLGDKALVTEADVEKYIEENKIPAGDGGKSELASRVKDFLEQQKLGQAAQEYLSNARLVASIKYYVNYPGEQGQ